MRAKRQPERRLNRSRRQLIAAIVLEHNQKENPVDLETQIVIVTRAFRILERIWKTCGPEEVWKSLSSEGGSRMPQKS